MVDEISVYRPTGQVPVGVPRGGDATPVERQWDSLRVAFVDNGKPNGANILAGVAEVLSIPAEQQVLVAKQIASRPVNESEWATLTEYAEAAVLAVGDCGSCTSWTCHDAVRISQELGIPSVLVTTAVFEELARHVATSLGCPDLPIITVEHPVGGVSVDEARARGVAIGERVRDALNGRGVQHGTAPTQESEPDDAGLMTIRADQRAIDDYFLSQSWSDGLPIVAPTPERVHEMLGRHIDKANEVLGKVPTRYGEATYRAIAVNAVMAGCLPSHFDVVVAAVKAIVDPDFNLHAIQATTHPVGPMILVNGPVIEEIGLNSGTNAFGPGNRANATIGRALRLVMLNVGGGVPGLVDQATFGQPGKYTFCFGENEPRSPWEPFHVSRGFDAATSTVTLFGVEGPHNINDRGSITAGGLLKTFLGTVSATGTNHHQFPRTEPLLVISPEHADLLATGGYTRSTLQQFFFEEARIPLSEFSPERIERFLARRRPVWFGPGNTTGKAALADSPSDFQIVVAGGAGTHSMFIPSFGGTASITVAIDRP
jgi:hypothetical protein